MYNNLARVQRSPRVLRAMGARLGRSARAPCRRGSIFRYGQGRERNARHLSRHRVPDAPVLVFIHGGYWRAHGQERPLLHGACASTTAASAWSSPTTRCAPARRGSPGRRCPASLLQMVRGARLDLAPHRGPWRRSFAHHRGRPFGRWAHGGDAAGLRLEGGRAGSARAAGAQRAVDLGPARPAAAAARAVLAECAGADRGRRAACQPGAVAGAEARPALRRCWRRGERRVPSATTR